ncbi:creatininase family protein [Cyanobium sp. Morenito 9A2]|uniref:creatininase family protein n=1 Tax=Cyanobium sp. Morenito 9A2 TaxID=2823718 RepID=UPI0020CD18D6|nr:creatininase family protein [Cyanobium sp. Morenito 9A2]MCP9849305.1 creatininase family protein [Cyanobium sp. Morenito 9A2]
MKRSLAHMAWPDVQGAARREGSTVLWPLGAFEQHGPHLPLGTDGLFAERIASAVLERLEPQLPIWRLPLCPFGFSPEHQAFPGTVSLPAELLIALVLQVGADLARTGFERLVLFNGHGGQIGLLQAAARQLRALHPELAVLPCFLWSGPEGVSAQLPEPERSEGLHAGLAETSLMLHLDPKHVGPDRPRDGQLSSPPPPGWSLEGPVPEAWLTGDLSNSGVVGDASGASQALGASLNEALVEGWSRLLTNLLTSTWPPRPSGGPSAPSAEAPAP